MDATQEDATRFLVIGGRRKSIACGAKTQVEPRVVLTCAAKRFAGMI
ncbi:MAG: hypothetical protein ABJQ70_15895 [Roseobacter sp.]